MNLFEVQERLKDFSKAQLVQEMQMPSGTAPPFLVLSELQRRTRMEQAMQAGDQGQPQSTVAEDAVASAGMPQGGLQDMARALAPKTDMTENSGVAPVQPMQEGGQVKSGSAQLQSVIEQAMGGASSPVVPQIMSYADRIAQLPIMAPPAQSTPSMPVTPIPMPAAPAGFDISSIPGMSQEDLASLLQTSTDQAMREAALAEMQNPTPIRPLVPERPDRGGMMQRASGGIVRGYQPGGFVGSLYDLVQDAPDLLSDEDWKSLYGDAWSIMKNQALLARGGRQPEEPFTGVPVASEMELRNRLREDEAPSVLSKIDPGLRTPADVYPDGRGYSAPYPSQPSPLEGRPEYPNEPVPEGLGLEGVINLGAATLGNGDMAQGHPLPDRLLGIPGSEDLVNRGPQYVGAMRNLIGLSDEGESMAAQLSAEDAVMSQPVPPRKTGILDMPLMDDAKAARGFGRTSYLSGLEAPAGAPLLPPGTGDKALDAIRETSEAILSPFMPDTAEDLARQSAEEAAAAREESGITESLRTPEGKAAAVVAAREASAAPTTTQSPSAATSGRTGPGGATGAPANAEMSESERLLNQDKWFALARVGLGLMASRAPTFGQALGEAGMMGMESLTKAREDYLERKQAEEIMALRRAAGARSGSAPMDALEFGLSAADIRGLDVLDTRLDSLRRDLERLGEDPGTGLFGMGGSDPDWERQYNNLTRQIDQTQRARDNIIMGQEIAALGGSAGSRAPGAGIVDYDISGGS